MLKTLVIVFSHHQRGEPDSMMRRQILAHRRDVIAHLAHCLGQLSLTTVEFTTPVLQLERVLAFNPTGVKRPVRC